MNTRKVIWIGFGFLTISLFWQIYDLTIPLILKDVFQLPDTLSGMVMSFDNVFALMLLPLIGVWSDRIKKRRPFILVGTLLAAFWLVWLPLAIYYESVVLFLVLLGLAVASIMLYRTPLVALMPDHVPEKHRSNANAIINFLGSIGTLAALWVVQSNLPQGRNYSSLFLSISFLLLLGSAVVLYHVKEGTFSGNEEVKLDFPRPKRSLFIMLLAIFLWFMAYNAVTSGFSKYAVYYLEMSGNRFVEPLYFGYLIVMVMYLPLGWVSQKLQARRSILVGLFAMLFSTILAGLYTQYAFTLVLVLTLAGLGWALVTINALPYVIHLSGLQDIGLATGYYYTASMAGQIITPILSGMFFDLFGYGSLFPYATFFFLAALMVFLGVPTHAS